MEARYLMIDNWVTVPRKKDGELYDKPVRIRAIGRKFF